MHEPLTERSMNYLPGVSVSSFIPADIVFSMPVLQTQKLSVGTW